MLLANLHLDAVQRRESKLLKTLKKPRKSVFRKSRRAGEDWVAEITPVPSAQQKPIKDDNTIEIDKWLKLVERYWNRNARRKKA